MLTQEAETEDDLIESLLTTSQEICHVNRELVIKCIGSEKASLLFPEIPSHLAVSTRQLLVLLDQEKIVNIQQRLINE